MCQSSVISIKYPRGIPKYLAFRVGRIAGKGNTRRLYPCRQMCGEKIKALERSIAPNTYGFGYIDMLQIPIEKMRICRLRDMLH